MHSTSTWFVGFGLGFAVLATLGFAQPARPKADERFFADKVAPILKKHCIACHNPDKARGGLDLSSHAGTLTGGDKGPAIVAGDSAKSLLAKMIRGPMPKMPKMADPLGAADVDVILHWIDGGAPWPKQLALFEKTGKQAGPWWSLQPIVKPALPVVKDAAWIKNEIDRFILATLEAKGMKPSAAADRATYIRRVTFDLHGLPPTAQEIDDFVNDQAADAFEKLVDRLLASPRYGERWARLWLDLVHYADTHGYDKDKRRLWAWLYRDWVIRAFNSDMPYRRFVRYQLAGDLLFPADPDGIIATGFVVAGPWDFVGQVELREGTIDKEKTRVLDRDDMVANTISTFCSLTAHCARCHDHKFDPIPTKEYYQLQAIFAGVERGDRPVASQETQTLKAELKRKRDVSSAKRDAILKKIAGLNSPELEKIDDKIARTRAILLRMPIVQAGAGLSPTNGYHSGIAKTADATKWVQVDLGKPTQITAVRLLPARPTDFADTPGFGFPLRYKITLSDDEHFAKSETLIDHTQADVANPGDQPVAFIAGKQARYVRVTANKLWQRTNDYVFALGEMQVFARDAKNAARAAKVSALDSIEAGRWSTRHLVDGFTSRSRLIEDADVHTRLAYEVQVSQAEAERKKAFDRLVDADTRSELLHLGKELETIAAQIATLQSSMKVYAALPIPPRAIHVLERGDVERKGALAAPGALSLLKGLDRHFAKANPLTPSPSPPEHRGRGELAAWIVDDDNVLTWRSIANRVWQYHFGKGIVDTPNDFGRNGSQPTHPELLDWLASEFRDADSFKKLHRKILLSAAYRQASAHDAAKTKLDADNRYLWRMNRQRLDAESIRDSVLAISGKIDYKMHGPGYDLFRFKDDHSPIYDHLDLDYINRPESWRRTVYRFVVRSVPNPFLETLDCADPNINVPVRNTTMTALQALALLNNPFMVKQAEYFAERVQAQEKTPARQVEAAYRLAFGRTPTPAEQMALTAYLERHGLANACRLLFNANEFVFVD